MKYLVKVPVLYLDIWEVEADTPEQAQNFVDDCDDNATQIETDYFQSLDCEVAQWGVGHYDDQGNWITDIEPTWKE